MNSKHAFVVYAGANETGRAFHALTHARQAHSRKNGSAVLFFAAEGTCWPGALANDAHPMHSLYAGLLAAGVIQGACENCAIAFGHEKSARAACGLVRGGDESNGQIDILGLEDEGYRVWLF